MGLIDRLKRITLARIEAYLDAVENPELILPQLVKELSQKVQQAATAEAKALSAVKGANQKLDQATGRVSRLKEGARLALQAGDENTARQAIAAQLQAEKPLEQRQHDLDVATNAYHQAHQVRQQLQSHLNELQTRKNEILARVRRAKEQKEALRAHHGAAEKHKAILDEVARMEAKVTEAESEAEVQADIAETLGLTLDTNAIQQALRNHEVQSRLDELKKQIESEE